MGIFKICEENFFSVLQILADSLFNSQSQETEVVLRRSSVKKVFVIFRKINGKTPAPPATLSKKETLAHVILRKFLRKSILKNNRECLLLTNKNLVVI